MFTAELISRILEQITNDKKQRSSKKSINIVLPVIRRVGRGNR